MSRYIDADALMEELLDSGWEYKVDQQPTADVRPNVRGEWIEPNRDDVVSYGPGYKGCSNCGKAVWLGKWMNFCPNCGADMRGEADGTTD